MDPLKMYFLLNMVIFHCYVSLPEGNLMIQWFPNMEYGRQVEDVL